MLKSIAVAAATLMTMLSMPAPAAAADYLFTLSGDDQASFILPASPHPDEYLSEYGYDVYFGFNNVKFGLDIDDGSPLIGTIHFASAVAAGGLSIYYPSDDYGFASVTGAQLYTGSVKAPTFKLGSYDFTTSCVPVYDPHTDEPYPCPIDDHLVISEVTPSGVPEPASWALLVMGFGTTGATMRRRQPAATIA